MSFLFLRKHFRTLSVILIYVALLGFVISVWARPQQAGVPARDDGRTLRARKDDRLITPAALITVNSTSDVANSTDGLCTLREAITAANNNTASGAIAGECAAGSSSNADQIDLTGISGTITLASALPQLASNMEINGPGPNTLTIQRSAAGGTPNFRIFIIPATIVNISGVKISGGNGGISNNSGTLALTNVNVSANNTVNGGPGGGISNSGTLNLTNSTVSGNFGDGGGGGILSNGGSVTLTNCIVSNNTVGVTSGGGIEIGPSINSGGTLVLTNTVVSGNGNAGIINGGSFVSLTSSSVSGNFGSGIAIGAGTLEVTNSTVSGNAGSSGGGIINNGGATLTNTTISGNTATFLGGGIFNMGGMTLIGCTVSNNNAANGGGGISRDNFNNRGTTNLRSTIVANNTNSSGNGTPDLSGRVNSLDYNLIGKPSGVLIQGTTTHNITDVDPRLGPLANNGGPTMTHALLAGSPALDAGDNSLTAAPLNLSTDQRGAGLSRQVDGPDADTSGAVDIGAYEAQVSLEDISDQTITKNTQLQFSFNVGGDTITSVAATSANTTLVPNNPGSIAVSGSGSTRILTINPAINQLGTSVISVTVNGSNGQNMTDTFVLTVVPINQPPSFTKGPDQTVNNNAGPQSIANWATNISPGPGESNQSVAFQITGNTNPGMFTDAPAISSNGALTYQPAANSGGSATITVVLKDDGGTANGGIDTSAPQTFNITVNPIGGFINFSAATYNATESSGFVTITVKRTGDLTRTATVDYASSGDNGLPCATANGVATPKCDFTTALGTLSFAAGDDTKTVTILISQDAFVEGPESFTISLSNQTGGAALAAPATATTTIADDVTEPSTNLIDDVRNFVRQHYHDFLNREPDQSGWDFWSNQITSCGSDGQCNEVRRIDVSASFFLSIEFQNNGYLVERFYKVAYGNANGNSNFGGAHQLSVPIVRFNEFLQDTQRIGRGVIVLQPGWEQALENNKQAYENEFVLTTRFINAFPTSLTPAQFVDQLDVNAGNVLSATERTTVINSFGGTANSSNTSARAQALRQVAEDTDLYNAEYNRAFVLAQYFGYLRRNPNDAPDSDYTGYDFWLTKLNQFNGNYINAEMVKAFLSSIEYRQRFGP